MSWIDELRGASFREAKFSVRADKLEAGRTVVRHDFPGVDFPYVEDLGKSAREFSIDAFIVGDDFITKRDSLLLACETAGPGVLVHPYYGRRYVTLIGRATVTHQADEGRMCVITMQFVETPNIPQPVAGSDEFSNTVAASGKAMTAVNNAFQKAFTVAGQIGYVVDSARAKLNTAIDAIRSIKAQARKLAAFSDKIGRLATDLNILMLSPSDLVYSLHDVLSFDFGGGNLSNPYNLQAKISDFYELRKLFTFGDSDVLPTGISPSIIQDAANLLAINKLIQTSAAVLAARSIVDIDFVSYEDAKLVRDIALDKIDSIMESTEDDDLYVSLIELKAKIVKNIEVRSMDLAVLQTHTPIASIPSLVLSHKLYGSLSREQDIIDRNKIQNPAIISGSVPLEVLSE